MIIHCSYYRHIEEDSEILTAEALSKMTPEELEFHYFSAHDFDKNSMLDGLELLKVRTILFPHFIKSHLTWVQFKNIYVACTHTQT